MSLFSRFFVPSQDDGETEDYSENSGKVMVQLDENGDMIRYLRFYDSDEEAVTFDRFCRDAIANYTGFLGNDVITSMEDPCHGQRDEKTGQILSEEEYRKNRLRCYSFEDLENTGGADLCVDLNNIITSRAYYDKFLSFRSPQYDLHIKEAFYAINNNVHCGYNGESFSMGNIGKEKWEGYFRDLRFGEKLDRFEYLYSFVVKSLEHVRGEERIAVLKSNDMNNLKDLISEADEQLAEKIIPRILNSGGLGQNRTKMELVPAICNTRTGQKMINPVLLFDYIAANGLKPFLSAGIRHMEGFILEEFGMREHYDTFFDFYVNHTKYTQRDADFAEFMIKKKCTDISEQIKAKATSPEDQRKIAESIKKNYTPNYGSCSLFVQDGEKENERIPERGEITTAPSENEERDKSVREGKSVQTREKGMVPMGFISTPRYRQKMI